MRWILRRREPTQTARERAEHILRASHDDQLWLLAYLAKAAPAAFDLAIRDRERLKNRAAAGGTCLKCGKSWPLPTAPTYHAGVHGYVCDGPPCSPAPSIQTQPLRALHTGGAS